MAELKLNCPRLHNGVPDTGKHLWYNTDKECWICYVCGYKGRGPIPTDEVPEVRRTMEITISKDAKPLHDLLICDVRSKSLTVRAARKYLENHHVNPEEIAFKRRLLLDGRYLVFPVYRGREIIYFQKRDLFTKSFFNPSVTEKPLFWTHEFIADRPVFLVEAFLNACRIEKFYPAVASFGKQLSDSALWEIQSKCKQVIVCLDAGEREATQLAARRLKQVGVPHVYTLSLNQPVGKDVCDLPDRICQRLIRSVVPK